MVIKMIASDIDGTLLHSDSSISGYTISVLEKCRAKGIKVVPVTARGSLAKIPELAGVVDGLVSSNGAAVYIGNNLIQHRIMTMDNILRTFVGAVTNAGIKIAVESTKGLFYANEDITKTLAGSWMLPYEKVDFSAITTDVKYIFAVTETTDEIELAKGIIEQFLPDEWRMQVRATEGMIVIMHRDTMKSKGLSVLAERWGIKPSEIVAFGDDTIDIDLLEYCGTGVAVSNALAEVKNIADDICASNNDDGVARWIEKHML